MEFKSAREIARACVRAFGVQFLRFFSRGLTGEIGLGQSGEENDDGAWRSGSRLRRVRNRER